MALRRGVIAILVWGAIGAHPAIADPLAAELLYPTNGNLAVDLTKPFYWAPVSSAQAYFLTIGSAPGKADLFSSGETTVTSMLVPKSLPKGKTIYARLWTRTVGAMRYSSDVSFAVANATPSATPTPTPTPTPWTPTPTPTPSPTPQTTPTPPSSTPTPTATPTPTPTTTPTNAPPITTSFASGTYPILWEGNGINFSGDVGTLSFFTPTFGAERSVVNPAAPQVIGNRVVFAKAGEYYLTVPGGFSVKVLVLGVNEPISSAVTRIFDFWVANSVFAADDDDEFYADQAGYVDRFFVSRKPMVVLCGPTHTTLAKVVSDVLGLPTRRPTFPGTFRWEGAIAYLTHNPVEIYLPDQGKWALFDVNYAFTTRWMSAQDLCSFVRSAASPRGTGFPDAYSFITLPVHDAPKAFLANDPSQNAANLLTSVPISYAWRDTFRFYYGGVAYWGDQALFQMPHGTEFLQGWYLWASLQTDPELEEAARQWIESGGIPVTIVSPDTLAALLADGHRNTILQEAWKFKVPSSVLAASTADLPVIGKQPVTSLPRPVKRKSGR